MENNRNWQGWVALALAGLALMVALVGRNPAPNVTVSVGQAPVAPAAPGAPPAPQPPFFGGRGQGPGQDWRGSQQSAPPFGSEARGFGRQHGHMDHFGPMGHRHGFPFFLPFMLVGGLIKLAGVALIVGLLVRYFRSRRDRPQPPAGPAAGQA